MIARYAPKANVLLQHHDLQSISCEHLKTNYCLGPPSVIQ